jgi:RHS repeat-associated protein
VVDGPQDLAYVYDKAGRLVQVKQASGAVLAEYTYGAGNSGSNYALGKLVLAVRHNATDYGDEVVSESFTYGGRMGRLSGKQTQLALRYPRLETRTFVQSFVWNELGDLASQGYPDDQGLADPARVVSYGYDNGYLTAVGGFVTSQVYHPNGMVFRRSLANGVMEEVALDSSKMVRPGQVRVVGPSGQEYWNSGTFVYDGVGNVKALVRSSTDQDVYVYDLVSRLVYARFKTAGGGIKEESLSYDAFGNLLSSVSTDYGSRSWSVDGVNRLAGCGYDAAGRMTACGGLTLSWTGAGELGKVQGTGINRSFLYTASGEKVMVRNELLGTAAVSLRDLGGNPVRHYLYSGGSWSWLGDDIFLGRLRIAQVTSSGTRYFHGDHLGSVRRVSTGAGALEKAYDFFPYGLPVKETVGQERLWFGGYELEHQNSPDYTDDLYFLHARWYFPYMGRFLSADPVRGDPAQPQSLNLYAYVRGNPLNAVDPDGRVVILKFAMPGDRLRFLNQLRWLTGLNVGVNRDGSLVIRGVLKDGAGKLLGSEKARELLKRAISSDKTYLVAGVRDSKDVFGGDSTKGNRAVEVIRLDPADFERFDYGGNRRLTLDVGMAFFHELGHAMFGYEDPPGWSDELAMRSPGLAVELANRIRWELGLPLRKYYHRGSPECQQCRGFVLFTGGPIFLNQKGEQ